MNANKRPCPKRRRTTLLLALATTLLLAVGVASAGATSSIEGVWSFNGGQIAVQPLSDGTFVGTVVVQTNFAECTHPVGQQIWSGITPQPDGSYWGYHQWYFETSSCPINPELGHTAWRVLESSDGSRYLRVCLSSPGTSQPTIAANGTDTNASYGCVNSALTAPLPTTAASGGGSTGTPASGGSSGTASFIETLSLPSSKKCLSLRLFRVHLQDPTYDPFKTVTLKIRGHKIKTVTRGKYVVATINLRGLPRKSFTLDIHATTVLGHHLSAHRTYHTCVKKKSSKKA